MYSSHPTTPGIFIYLFYNVHEIKEKKFYPSMLAFLNNQSYKWIYLCAYTDQLTWWSAFTTHCCMVRQYVNAVNANEWMVFGQG